jgi:N6-L-threonylcarbamoyladenine synthase
LKTAVSVYIRQEGGGSPDVKSGSRPERREREEPKFVADVCASFQEAAVDVLVAKAVTAALEHRPASVILVGGVAANAALRQRLATAVAQLPIYPDRSVGDTNSQIPTFHVPELAFTGDNAAMIGAAGCFRAQAGDFTDPLALEADPNMRLAEKGGNG